MAVSDYQCSFNGLTLGANTPWLWADISGLEGFDTRTTDTTAPNAWGTIPGTDFVVERTVVLIFRVVGTQDKRQQLENAFLPTGATLLPFVYKLPNREEIQIMARCRRRQRVIKTDSEYGIVDIAVEMGMPDPRRYSSTAYSASVSPFAVNGGGFELATGAGVNLGFDLTVSSATNLGFGLSAVVGGGLSTCVNSGNVDTYPTITVSTPLGSATFRVTNQTTGDVVLVNQNLNAGDSFVMDMSAMVGGSTVLPVVFNGVSRFASWQAPRLPLRLQPGNNVIQFDVVSGSVVGASAVVAWRNAFL